MELSDYCTKYLFLLVGANPLPNYVAALLLARDSGTVYLLHTKGTDAVAGRLEHSIKDKRSTINLVRWEVDEADGQKIKSEIAKIEPPGRSVGLNYTGGTKPMSVHAYHALRKAFPEGCFSYLDARTLKMFINRGDERTQTPSVGRAVEMSLEELLALHDYELKDSDSPPRQIPNQPELCRAIEQVHRSPTTFQQWRRWINQLGGDSPSLPTLAEYPALTPVIEAFANLSGGQTPAEAEVARAIGFDKLKSCSKFFFGGWLEEYTLDALSQFAGRLGIKHLGIALQPQKAGRREFDLDVAAMVGYQLFAISCIVTDQVGKAKEHLLEVFVRARQVGGDEARFGLVCLVKDPVTLQREIEQDWDAEGKIQVFGRRALPRLAAHLRNWFETANKEKL